MNLDPGPIRIFTVDDHALLREGIAALVDAEPDMKLVAEASNGEEAIEKFRLHRPDITLMDLQMPGMSGIEAITRIQAEFSGARIIVLTTYTGDVQVLRALKAGARGYILKGKVHRELLGAIRAVHSGQKQIPPEIAAELAEHLQRRYQTAKVLKFSSPTGDWWVRVRVRDDDRQRAQELARETQIAEAPVFLVRLD